MKNISKLTCNDCMKRQYCTYPCIFIDKLAGGYRATKELIPPPEPPDNGIDYKTVLIDIQEQREASRKRTISDIRQLQDERLRAIAALLYAGFKVTEIPYIVEILDIKVRRIYRIIEECTSKPRPSKG